MEFLHQRNLPKILPRGDKISEYPILVLLPFKINLRHILAVWRDPTEYTNILFVLWLLNNVATVVGRG